MASSTAQPASSQPQLGPARQPQGPPPPMVVQTPYVPTQEEEAYLEECGKAIVAGSDAATSAGAAGNGGEYAQFAQGVKALTDAYTAIKHGGNVSRHQGS